MNAKLRAFALAAAAAALFIATPAQAQHNLYNKVLQLDGNGDFVNIPAGTPPAFTTQFTVEAWISTSVATGDQAIVSRYNNNSPTDTDDAFQLTLHNGKPRFQIAPQNAPYKILDSARFVADGTWHHVAATYNGTGMRIYVDGVFDTGKSVTGTLNDPPQTNMRIGASLDNGANGFFFNGQIDDARLWDKALTVTEISVNRNYPIRNRSGSYSIRQVWRFNGGVDTGIGTLTGNAQLVTPAVLVPVQQDSFLRLDGDQEYVLLPASSSGLSFGSAMTVEAWVRPLSSGSLRSVVSKFCHNSNSLTDDAYFLGIEANGRPRFQVSVGSAYAIVNGNASVVNNGWHHLAGVFDGNQIRLYVDGVLQSSAPCAGSMAGAGIHVYIGASREGTSRVDADFFHGDIDDVRLWNYALGQGEIQTRMNSCWTDLPSGLMARYVFEGELMNRRTMNSSEAFWGRPAGAFEGMYFVGQRRIHEGSCP
jgi:hypothetical protein